ncbi:MAG TPA: ATP cone domain-containing protein [Gemmataceae bacterium]|nr:ATP cone domain-containing protein [Gemmataceae bacterium]
MADELEQLPVWVRRIDGSQVPFEADRICQSLYAAAESLGTASAFLIRELSDVVLHFLAQADYPAIPSTAQIAEHVEKIVREVGHPALARRYAELRQRPAEESAKRRITLAWPGSADELARDCQRVYALGAIFSRDIAAAVAERLLHLEGLEAPAKLASVIVEASRLMELPWWPALADWRQCAGRQWIVDSPESLCTARMHPALTPHLCERLLSLPMLGQREVELHLNVAESSEEADSPLFLGGTDESARQERVNFVDGLLERWKVLSATQAPALAWHLNERSFDDDVERRHLHEMIRQRLQGRAVHFVFDRPHSPVALTNGLDRKGSGILMEIGLDLPTLAARPDIQRDGAAFLKKLPSLARMTVSAARQKRQHLRGLPDASPLMRPFLIERAAVRVTPMGLDDAVERITGASLGRSPLSLDFAVRVLQTLRSTLHDAGRPLSLDLRLDFALQATPDQLPLAAKLHAESAIIAFGDEHPMNVDACTELLASAWRSTPLVRMQLQRAGQMLQQGELGL